MTLTHSHIPYERLIDWADGRLPANQQGPLAAHLESCPDCRHEAARVERILGAMKADASVDAPQALIDRAVLLFRPRAVAPSPSFIQRLTAALRFESAPMAPAFGMRSEGIPERQMVFSAGEYDLDLRVIPSPAGWLVSGQVLGAEVQGGECELAGEGEVLRAALNLESAFELPPAPAGSFSLKVSWDAVEVVVDELRLGSP